MRLNTGGAGDYSLGLRSTAAVFGVAGMYFEYSTTRASSGNTYAFSGIRKDGTLAATGCYGVGWINANLESNAASTVLGSANDTWYKIKLIIKSDDTIDIYVDDVFIENANPGTTLVGQALYLQLGGAYYSPVVGYKDVTIYDPRSTVDSSDFSAATGWTEVETQGAAVFDGEYTQTKTTADNWSGAGIYRTASTAMKAGDVIQFVVKANWSTQPESIIWLRFTTGIDVSTGTEGIGAFLHHSGGTDYLTRQNATSIDDLVIGSDVWYALTLSCNAAGHVHIWAVSDGDGPTKLIGSKTTQSYVDTSFYAATSVYTNGTTLKLDSFEWRQLPAPSVGGDGGLGGAAVGLFNKIFSNRRK